MRKLWIEIRSSLWFVPGVLVLAAIILGLGFVELDVTFADQLKPLGWLPFLNAGAEGARGMLTAIASSMITVAGVAFSITIVTLSLASTQYTPRILRNFMRDITNQVVLGVFVGIYAYCLIVLRTIRGGAEGGGFVPLLAVFFGVLLALVGIGYLIFFIHHIAASIQASYILDAITKETTEAIDKLFPQELGQPVEDESAAVAVVDEKTWHPIPAFATGYLQSVATETLMQRAAEWKTVLRLNSEVGEFVVEGAPILSSARALEDDALASLPALFAIGNFRTVDQDAGFGVRQIVDIALKALSPGVNDTTTAVSCLDYLGAILSRLARRRMASPYRQDGEELRVVAPAPAFGDFVAKSLDEIRLCAQGNVTIHLSMLRLLNRVAGITDDPVRRRILLEHGRLIVDLADRAVAAPYDRERINGEIALVRNALGGVAGLPQLTHTPSTGMPGAGKAGL
ncbi:MAG: DUF2254 domain-containing protein [Chthoniobacter sp.]|uniref:DUF2254 domain-containing protein n=1 Tax=Chthoniobacter sp. TaxID=2510640 RepID=UPI0032A9A02B